MQKLTKYTKNKLCIKLVLLYNNYIDTHGQQNTKTLIRVAYHLLNLQMLFIVVSASAYCCVQNDQ